MAAPTLIYCGADNKQFAEIALQAGFKLGVRLPDVVYGPLYFADQDWKKPDRSAYMAALAQHRPFMATVLDWERKDQLSEVLNWGEEAGQFVEYVLIIPKVIGGIPRIPRHVGGRDVVLAYSVPTRYGGTSVPLWEFAGRPVHLLGGSPQAQMNVWFYLRGITDVISADGNMACRMATRHCRYWVPGTNRGTNDRYWKALAKWQTDAPAEAIRRSCENIFREWQQRS